MAKKEFDMTVDDVIGDAPLTQNTLVVDESESSKETNTGTPKVTEVPEEITVTIDGKKPVIVLFGAKSSGKTMTLVRLARYLEGNGYVITPVETFRNSNSSAYKEACKTFMNNLNSENAAESTKTIDFLLLNVYEKNGGPLICRILEAPGEHYFDAEHSDKNFMPYILEIKKNRKYPKIWLYIVELGAWEDKNICTKYANKVAKMSAGIASQDKVIVMCHKADEQEKKGVMYHKGVPVYKEFFNALKDQYSNILDSNKNTSPITSLWHPYNFDFVVFSAGEFTYNPKNKKKTYIESDEMYPRKLWNTIKKGIKGRWF
jgi:hypothetical protein